MKIATMRKMDFYWGVPATFFLMLCLKVKRLFFPLKKELPSSVRNILFIELSEMGSMVLLSPLINKVRKTYPQANIYFITFHYTTPALAVLQMINENNILILRTSKFSFFLWDILQVIATLIRIPFDITFDLELFSRVSSILSFFSGAHARVGFDNFMAEGLYRGSFLTHPVTYNPHQHITKNFLSMYYALQEPWEDIPHSKCVIMDQDTLLPAISFDPQKVVLFKQKLYTQYPNLQNIAKLVVLNPNSSQIMPLRRWPLTSYLALAQRLVENPGIGVVVTGSQEEKSDTGFICGALANANVADLAGFTTMEELIALYHIADILVSNDSGPAHFGALAAIKTITLFGPETPDLYKSLNPNAFDFYKHLQCSPCSTAYNNRISPCKNNVCMQLITVDEVYNKLSEMLA